MEQENTKHDPYAVLRKTPFVLFLNFRFFLTLAIQIQSVSVGWQVYQHTKDEFWLGLIGLAEALPFIAVSFFSGHIADIFSRKKILLYAVALLSISMLGLLVFCNNPGILKKYGIYPIFVTISFTGIVRSFLSAATVPFMSQIVSRELYTNAATWNSTVWHTGQIIGPAIAGLICTISFSVSYTLSLVFTGIAFICISFIRSPPKPIRQLHETLYQSLTAGIKFVFNNQLILSAISLDLFAVLFGGAVAILPAFADKVLNVGAAELGVLRAMPALGAVLTAFLIAYFPPGKNAGKNLLCSIAGFGIATILFAFTTNVYLAMLFLMLTGAFDNVSVVIRHSILQLVTPNHMRGRVSAVNSIFIGSSNEIGAFESGLAAKLLGLRPSVIFGGIMTILVVLIAAKYAPKLRSLNMKQIIG